MLAIGILRRAIPRIPVRTFSSTIETNPSWEALLEPIPKKKSKNFLSFLPEENEKNNYEINWSLADDDITPRYNCYRNFLFDENEIKKNKKKFNTLIESNELNINLFFNLWEDITNRIGFSKDLYIADGAIGGHADIRTSVRVVSDSAEISQAFLNMLVKVPSVKNPHTPRPILIVYETNSNENLFVYNIDTNENGFKQAKVIIRGDINIKSILKTILKLKKKLNGEESENIILNGDIMIDNDFNTSIVFNTPDLIRGKNQNKIISGHGLIWNKNIGMIPAYQGIIIPTKDIEKKHEKYPVEIDNENSIVKLLSNTVIKNPKNFIVYGNMEKEITVDEFLKLIDYDDTIELKNTLKEQKIKCFIKKNI